MTMAFKKVCSPRKVDSVDNCFGYFLVTISLNKYREAVKVIKQPKVAASVATTIPAQAPKLIPATNAAICLGKPMLVASDKKIKSNNKLMVGELSSCCQFRFSTREIVQSLRLKVLVELKEGKY